FCLFIAFDIEVKRRFSVALPILALGISVLGHPGGHHLNRREITHRAGMGLHAVIMFRDIMGIVLSAPYFETIQNDTCVLTPEVTQGSYVFPPSQILHQDMTEDRIGFPL
ncbi:hypothetical protein N7478_000380, partial [Penicillium angulare]|uniref:uncharacterized protein n=1 Tax=Penicillium angulare TaxID=116970 RepID=UPI002540A080